MTTPTQTKPTPAAAPAPRFNPAAAILVPCRRHEPTARTVSFVQPAGAGSADLFSVCCVHIATVPESAAAAFLPAPEKPSVT